MNNSTIPLPTAAQQAAATGSSNITLIIVALAMGLIAAGINYWYIQRVENQISLTSKPVYRLLHQVNAGDKLRVDRDLEEVRMPAQFAEGLKTLVVIGDKERDRQGGQAFLRAVQKGELLSNSMFTSDTALIESKITEGKRACPLPINSRNPSGILRAGMLIDLLADFTPSGGKTPQSIPVLERVKVLAVGTNIDESGKTARTGSTNITVEVDQQVGLQLLTVAKFIGRDGYDVLIRNPGDLDYKHVKVNKQVLKLVGLEE